MSQAAGQEVTPAVESISAVAGLAPHILIIEDSATQAALLRFDLEEGGYAVTVGHDGAEGLSLARAHAPALILSDIMMPELDGYALCRAIKADPALAHIPVILMTMLTNPDDVIKGLACGADNFLRKPYELKYLLSNINYLLTNRQLRGPEPATIREEVGIAIQFGGRRHDITSGRQQILDLLISTYEQAVRVTEELLGKDGQLQRSYDAIEALYRLANELSVAETPAHVFDVALTNGLALAGASGGWIWIADGDGRFRCAAARALPASLQEPEAMEGTCECQRRLLDGTLGRVVNILQCARASGSANQTNGGLHHASVPLRAGEDTIGIMNLLLSTPLAAESLSALDGLANHVAATLARLRLQEQLKTSNQELEAFAYSVAHDLRAPIRHMDGFATLLLNRAGGQLDETATRYVHTIQQSATKMSRLIDDLLGLSRTSRAALQPVRVDLGALVQEVREELAPGLRERRITWSVAPLPPVQADPGLLRIVLVNLLSNAVKYSGPRAETHIEIGADAQNGEVVVHVRDNGVGFDMQYADKLFGVFQRLHSDEQFEGTGIGLATVRRIITRHGGRVWAEGTLDHGATFFFSLPQVGSGSDHA